ncbi:hypothetical protein A2803_01185 [Candidatus Woesebacteria bacterium RIFCSPHIGHO2_01_FULL_44_21]|uniref:Uncharacterized protein n=1 Tax=Candidatus Woesebacteria bacterium RIFCSPHIGHO2_01_FULL_44_21 TaxID=1802503 RepID=A0A1F7YZ74_9BACT|nr:MAG: hypothetical protein A2803_01185 [Candidatus Woesebacteria bacterium RIFCSPHIGHO2_01_FULL_44_21]OGM70806.1 MAG: hypothetical protein A2897_05175 [Candidatus Woesebacteria bacterium RIFCSPLOWO2_01_FULL_44_24b]
MPQKGFAAIVVIVGILAVVALILVALKAPGSPQVNQVNYVQTNPASNSDEPPLKLKSIGVNFSDFKFTKERLQFNRLFMDYGFVIPADTSSTNKDKANPQPTFVVPLGTPARSLVDGVVAAIPTLWSGDFSVQVTADGKMQKWIYETEHLINLKVKVGDKVTAGQIVGEVSDFNNGAPEGFGAVEMGILKGGNPPEHVCPFAFLDESIKEETLTKIKALYISWEDYIGDETVYDEDSYQFPGCLTLDPIEG